MVDSMRVRLDQCKEVLLIAGELESMKVQMSVVYILEVIWEDHCYSWITVILDHDSSWNVVILLVR
jgi:hypothetical protein